jgi:MerR family transcriptional regulator, mercuric resistance operon regulatory protein
MTRETVTFSKRTRGRVARELRCGIERLRFYEKIDLIDPPHRAENGYRIYDQPTVSRLRLIINLSGLGFGIAEIREILDVLREETAACDAVERIATEQLNEIRSKIHDLRRLETELAARLKSCSQAKSAACPLIAELS